MDFKELTRAKKYVKLCKSARSNSLNVVNVVTRRYRDIFEINNARCNTEKAAFSIMNLFVPLFRIYALQRRELFFFVVSFIFSVV